MAQRLRRPAAMLVALLCGLALAAAAPASAAQLSERGPRQGRRRLGRGAGRRRLGLADRVRLPGPDRARARRCRAGACRTPTASPSGDPAGPTRATSRSRSSTPCAATGSPPAGPNGAPPSPPPASSSSSPTSGAGRTSAVASLAPHSGDPELQPQRLRHRLPDRVRLHRPRRPGPAGRRGRHRLAARARDELRRRRLRRGDGRARCTPPPFTPAACGRSSRRGATRCPRGPPTGR